jgi:F-type H+-transporting ATPase subunit delta
MEELIAKRYVKAIQNSVSVSEFENIYDIFSILAKEFENSKFAKIIFNSTVSRDDKLSILLNATKPANSQKVDNLVRLLVEKNRLAIIPFISMVMKKELAKTSKKYHGFVYSDTTIDESVMQKLSSGLSKKFDSTISLTFIKEKFNGVKVNVEDLGIEINFSKDRINSQMIEHIIKAI